LKSGYALVQGITGRNVGGDYQWIGAKFFKFWKRETFLFFSISFYSVLFFSIGFYSVSEKSSIFI